MFTLLIETSVRPSVSINLDGPIELWQRQFRSVKNNTCINTHYRSITADETERDNHVILTNDLFTGV